MIGSDHAGRINAVATDEKDSFNLGGDLAFVLYRKILLRTKGRLDLSLDECIQAGREAVMEEEFFRAVSMIFPFREGYDRTAAVQAWSSYVSSLHFINMEVWRGAEPAPLLGGPSPEDVLEIKEFIGREYAGDGGETQALMKELADSLRAAHSASDKSDMMEG
jgi:hypothetical protein